MSYWCFFFCFVAATFHVSTCSVSVCSGVVKSFEASVYHGLLWKQQISKDWYSSYLYCVLNWAERKNKTGFISSALPDTTTKEKKFTFVSDYYIFFSVSMCTNWSIYKEKDDDNGVGVESLLSLPFLNAQFLFFISASNPFLFVWFKS